MKHIRPFINGLVACSIALAMATSLAAQSVEQGTAKVVRIKGSARYMTPGSSMWQPLRNGAILKPGTVLQTASGSYVDLVLNNESATTAFSPSLTPIASYRPMVNQNAIRVFQNTVLAINQLSVNHTGADVVTDTQLDLKAGRIFGTVKKLSAASKFEVKIPNGVAGIRGTIFFVDSSGLVSVVEGSVVVAYMGPDGKPATMEIPQGQQFDVTKPQLGNQPIPSDTPIPGVRYETMQPITFAPDHTIEYVSPIVPRAAAPE